MIELKAPFSLRYWLKGGKKRRLLKSACLWPMFHNLVEIASLARSRSFSKV